MTPYRVDPEIWTVLADLFFLDDQHGEEEYRRAADLLKSRGWTRQETLSTLVELVGPATGGNIGYLILPAVAGVWGAFNGSDIERQVRDIMERRAKLPKWRRAIEDRHCRWMVERMGVNQLLDLL